MTEPSELPRRGVRSFVLRGGRITEAQQRALTELWPRYGLAFSHEPLNFAGVFGRQAPVTLEIGFGNGEHLLQRATVEPQRDFVGVEVHRPGVGRLLLSAHQANVRNLRIICHDAVEVLREQIPPASLDEIQILFPDPWHKKRHHKRRLIQSEFIDRAAVRLVVGGRLHLATDWEPYAQHMLEVLRNCPLLENSVPTEEFTDAATSRIATRFERRGTRLGHVVRDMIWLRHG